MSSNSPKARNPLPSMFRVAVLLIGLGLRRSLNRVLAITDKKAANGARLAVGRKKPAGQFVAWFFITILMFAGSIFTTRAIERFARDAERRADPNTLVVSEYLMFELQEITRGAISRGRLARAGRNEARDGFRSDDEVDAHVALIQRRFDERGIAGFRQSRLPDFTLWPSSSLWYGDNHARGMLIPLGLIALLLIASAAFSIVSDSMQDLAKAESHFEWLFTFPVPTRGLLLSRVFETAFTTPIIWILLFPFSGVVFVCAGYSYVALPLAALSTAYIGFVLGSIRVALETTLRRFFSLRTIGRLQTVFSALWTILLVMTTALSSSHVSDMLAEIANDLPSSLLIHPFTPLALAAGGSQAVYAALGCIVVAIAMPASAATLGGWMLRDGLIDETSPNAGPRERACSRSEGPALRLGPVVQKEFQMLFRDRTLYTQALISPVLVVGSQLLVNRNLSTSLAENPNHAAVMVFGVTAFTLGLVAFRSLAHEGSALWVYSTVPLSMTRVLAQKAVFWAALAAAIMTLIFAGINRGHAFTSASGIAFFALALTGVVLVIFLAAGIGALATDPFATEPRRRVRASMAYLFLAVSSLFSYSIYSPSMWAKFVQIVLTTVLVFAVWQKVRERMPFLLDPVEAPRPSIAVADGLIAALTFFVLQGLLTLTFSALEFSNGASLVLGFSGAGLMTFCAALFVFWRSQLPNLTTTLGLVAPPSGVFRALALGITGGLIGGALAAAYLEGVSRIEFLDRIREETISLGSGPNLGSAQETAIWISVLAIVAAPLAEEFLFRGILYRGFRHSYAAKWAALASALVFALVHPAISFVPVFAVGLISALIYERSRSLLAPIATHMTYNAIVIGLTFSAG